MSDRVSALAGASSKGFVEVSEAGLVGMVTIRGDLGDEGFGAAVSGALGVGMPEPRKLVEGEGVSLLWMSPDELLLVCDHAQATEYEGKLSAALDGQHHLLAVVSDARAVFDVSGPASALRDMFAKLTPADVRGRTLGVAEVRRTRFAQVPAAFWFTDDEAARVVCFRSQAAYVFGLLAQVSKVGSEPEYF